MSNKKTVTMTDIAKALNISTVSVSKALQNKDGIGEKLRLEIIAAANEMGYRYNLSAKAMKTGSTFNIGILISQKFLKNEQAFYWEVCSQINQALSERAYFGIVETVTAANEKAFALPNILQSQKVDAVIVLGQLSSEYLAVLSNEGRPLVLADFYTDDANYHSVTTDNFYSAYILTNYILQNGHKKIGFIGSIGATSSILDRYLGFCRAMIEHGLQINKDWIIDDRNENGDIEITALPKELPTAFVCNCDQTAHILCNYLTSKGLNVPKDISLAGFDNNIFATLCTPPLTTIEVDTRALAASAAQSALSCLESSNASRDRKVIPGKLIIRSSVKKI